MKLKAICVLLFQIFLFSPVVHSESSSKVAILEFQNKAGTIIITNRWTMAEDLAKKLRKKNKNIQTVSRKDIMNRLNELSWSEERLSQDQEAKLTSLGVKYVVYTSIVQWRSHGEFSNTEVQDASEGNVILLINVVDLTTGESVKTFTADGAATAETGFIVERDPASFTDENQSEDQMYEATKVALIKATDILADVLADR
jgi:hypothetical protein